MELPQSSNLRGADIMKVYRRRYVSREFYTSIRKHYPGINKRTAFARLFCYLLFPAWLEIDTGHTWLSQATVAEIEGVSLKANRRYSASAFLSSFQQEVGISAADMDVIDY